jgi:hypothetical protein
MRRFLLLVAGLLAALAACTGTLAASAAAGPATGGFQYQNGHVLAVNNARTRLVVKDSAPANLSGTFTTIPTSGAFFEISPATGECLTAAAVTDARVTVSPCAFTPGQAPPSQQFTYTTAGELRLRGTSLVVTDPRSAGDFFAAQMRSNWDGPNQVLVITP